MEALLVLGWLLTVAAFVAYLHHRDQRDKAERAELMQRIQAPVKAIHDYAPERTPPELPEPIPAGGPWYDPVPDLEDHDD